jgi:hypothetical protein
MHHVDIRAPSPHGGACRSPTGCLVIEKGGRDCRPNQTLEQVLGGVDDEAGLEKKRPVV